MRAHRKLLPNQFKANDAWIAFRLNGAPIRTERDGSFNCIALMDAASCFILASELFPIGAAKTSEEYCRRLLKSGENRDGRLPRLLYMPQADAAEVLSHEASLLGIEVVLAPDIELQIFIGDARQSFSERFEEPLQ